MYGVGQLRRLGRRTDAGLQLTLAFGLAAGVALSLIAQIGEQVDYLRFMPDKTSANARRWSAAAVAAGPGWVILGAIKQIGGRVPRRLRGRASGARASGAVEPILQFVARLRDLPPDAGASPGLWPSVLVVLSQVKINVDQRLLGLAVVVELLRPRSSTGIPAVSCGWSSTCRSRSPYARRRLRLPNFVLGFYSNVAIAWIGALVADLVINKPFLKVSRPTSSSSGTPVSVNPVGFVSMADRLGRSPSSPTSTPFGEVLEGLSPFLALSIAMVLSPVLAVRRRGCTTSPREPSLRRGRRAGEDREDARVHGLRPGLRAARHGRRARSTRGRSARCAARSRRAATTSARPPRRAGRASSAG